MATDSDPGRFPEADVRAGKRSGPLFTPDLLSHKGK